MISLCSTALFYQGIRIHSKSIQVCLFGCMNYFYWTIKSITQCLLTFLLSITFYLWHYFVYRLQNNRLLLPNGLNDVPEAVVLYPEGTYWLLYKLLSVYIISFLHCRHEVVLAFPYSNTFHLDAHKITNSFLFTAEIDKRILILWFRSSCCSIPTALKSLLQSKMKGNMGHFLQGPLLERNHWRSCPRWYLSRYGHLIVFYLKLLKHLY